MKLDERVSLAIDSWFTVVCITAFLAVGSCLFSGEWVAGLVVTPILIVVLYYFGIFAIGKYILYTTNPNEFIEEIQSERIKAINEGLENGSIEAGSPELERLMKEAGLRPLSVLESFGPVFGRHWDAELYEYIDAKQGSAGETKRYTYVAKAQFDHDGTVVTPDENLYIVVDGHLYEHVLAKTGETNAA